MEPVAGGAERPSARHDAAGVPARDPGVEDPASVPGHTLGSDQAQDAASAKGGAGCVAAKVESEVCELQRQASARVRVPTSQVLDETNRVLRNDLVRIVAQFLETEGYSQSYMTLLDEANVKQRDALKLQVNMRKISKAILEGAWSEAERLVNKKTLQRVYFAFRYALYRQQYLELIDRQEYQRAYTFLSRKLKALEYQAGSEREFADLCYLLTCKSVHEVPAFRSWDGVVSSRRRLVNELNALASSSLLAGDIAEHGGMDEVPPNRLWTLVRQAVRTQIAASPYRPLVEQPLRTLLRDYHCFVVPNARFKKMTQGRDNVKSVVFLGEQGRRLAAAGSEHGISVWDSDTGRLVHTFAGHPARVWDLAGSKDGSYLLSASADASVRLWTVPDAAASLPEPTAGALPNRAAADAALRTRLGDGTAPAVLAVQQQQQQHMPGPGTRRSAAGGDASGVREVLKLTEGIKGDVYTVAWHPGHTHAACGGFDNTVRLFDARTGQMARSLSGHSSAVTSLSFNPHGNLLISGSKDMSVRFWDVLSGHCVKTISAHLGEVTSVAVTRDGASLLTASKDNSNRLWDVRQYKPVQKYKGHQNTSRNFVRCGFGPDERVVVGGSEDGTLPLWDRDSGKLLRSLPGHRGIAYSCEWNEARSLLASCGYDGTVLTWHYDPSIGDVDADGERGHA